MADDVRPIDSAPTARAAQRKQAYLDRDREREREDQARRIADNLKADGAAVAACSDNVEREEARRAGRRAGRLLSCSIRTKVLEDGRVAVWQPERHANPLQAEVDEKRGNRRVDAYLERHDPPEDPQA